MLEPSEIRAPILPSSKRFGITISVFLFGISLLRYLKTHESFAPWLISGLLFFGLALGRPKTLDRLNRLWFNLGILLGKMMSPIVIGIVYFGIFTPFALVYRFFYGDKFQTSSTRPTESFWTISKEGSNRLNRFIRPF